MTDPGYEPSPPGDLPPDPDASPWSRNAPPMVPGTTAQTWSVPEQPQGGYPSPGYVYAGSDGQPYMAYPEYAYPYAPQPKKMSGLTKAVLIGLPILLLLVVGGAVAVIVGHHGSSRATVAGTDRFTLPASVDGLPKSDDPTMQDLTKTMTDALASLAQGPVAAGIYMDPADPTHIFILMGLPHVVQDPSAEIDSGLAGLGLNGMYTMQPPQPMDPGPLGGAMECEDGTISEGTESIPVGLCVIADGGGVLFGLYLNESGEQTAALLTGLRPSFEHK